MDPNARVTDQGKWMNPYISISGRYIALYSSSIQYGWIRIQREEILSKLRDSLSRLPTGAWPSGRVIGLRRHFINLDLEGRAEENWETVIGVLTECGFKITQLSCTLQT